MNHNLIKTALYQRLAADSTLTGLLADGTAGIHDTQAQQNAGLPLVVFTKPAGNAMYTMGQRSYDDQLWQIKAVTDGPSSQLGGSIVARIDALLDDQPLTLSGGLTCLSLRRTYDVPEYTETADGLRRTHQGAVYRLYVQ